MSQKYGVKIVFSRVKKDRLVGQMMAVVAGKREAWRAECIGNVLLGFPCMYHRTYPTLDLDLGDQSVLVDNNGIGVISQAIKAQTKFITLNYRPWTNNNLNCPLCIFQEFETVFLFIAIFPVITFYRRAFLGKPTLSKHEFNTYSVGGL